MIYRDKHHYFSEGKHGFTSASREDAYAIWEDLQETIEASRDDYKKAYLEMMKDTASWRVDFQDSMLEYIKEFMPDHAPKFWRWWFDKNRDEAR